MDPKTFSNIGIGLRISGLIAFPVIISFFLGRFIVIRFNTAEYVLYICIAIGVFSSFYGLIKEIKSYAKTLEIEDKSKSETLINSEEK